MNYEILSGVKTLVDRYSAPNYVGLVYRKWVTQLQNPEQLMDRSGRLNPEMVPNFV